MVSAIAAIAVATAAVEATLASTLPISALAGCSTNTERAMEMADDDSHAIT